MSNGRRLSLLETSVSLMLLLVVLGAVFTALNVAHYAERSGREREAAAAAANRALKDLRALGFDEVQRGANLPLYAFHVPVNTGAGLENLAPASAGVEPINPSAPERAGHVSVAEDPDGNGTTGLLEMRAVVAWKNAKGADERLELVTRRAQ